MVVTADFHDQSDLGGTVCRYRLILSGGTLLEIAVTTFVINIRYMLMSLSLSQKLDPDMKMAERLILSFGVTDEVFAVAIRQRKELTARYLAGLILTLTRAGPSAQCWAPRLPGFYPFP